MNRFALFLVLRTLACGAEHVRILRDEFGVPHIFASKPAGAAYGSGYAQSEDRRHRRQPADELSFEPAARLRSSPAIG
jgi:hypothetical protein